MMSTAVLPIHQLSLYNTGRMSSEQVITAFAARTQQLDRIINDIAAEKPKRRPQHHLVVGQRGMGKTMLLSRIAAELRTNPGLSPRFIPLVFAEEQYSVDRLSKFWLNCLDSLADARELAKDGNGVDEIDATVSRLTAAGRHAVKDDQPFADEVYKEFARIASAGGQRPVLLVDNLQLVFERLPPQQQHSLRELLMRTGSPILIGASPAPPPQSQDYGAAFYDQFKVHYLRPLEEAEMRSLLVHLAEVANRADVRARVVEHPARLTVLRQLTGGNPRTTLTLFFLYAEDFAPSVFGDLEGLLDRVTPLYKARFEELTPQQQVVASAVANHWDPLTAAKLAAVTGLPATTISAQLDRLEKVGFVERTELFNETSTGYQIAERFFNIWFLMRSASRRQRREVEFLTRFLESFYEPEDRSRLARHLMDEEHFSPDRFIWSRAVAASLTERETAEELNRHAELAALQEEARDARARFRDLFDFDNLQPATLAFNELREKLMSLVPEDAGITPEDFAKRVLGDRRMFMTGERQQLAATSERLTAAEVRSLLDVLETSTLLDEKSYSEGAVTWFAQRLASGQIRALTDAEDWDRAFRRATGRDCVRLLLDSMPDDVGYAITDEGFQKIQANLQPTSTAPAHEWRDWGGHLQKLTKLGQAETAYREAIARDPESAWNHCFLGDLLSEIPDRHAEAETAYRESIARGTANGWAWNGLGQLLAKHPHRSEDAEAAFRHASGINPTNEFYLINLGNLLRRQVGRLQEAENTYREALAVDPLSPWPALNLALLAHAQGRYEEAESLYRRSTELRPTSAATWAALADLYHNELHQPNMALEAFNNVLRLDPLLPELHHARLFLQRDVLGETSSTSHLLNQLRRVETEVSSSLHLQEALFAAYEANWGKARDALTKAVQVSGDISSVSADHLSRTVAVMLHLDYGAELLHFLEEADSTRQSRPLVEAVKALAHSDRNALLNVAPEVRTTAEIIYDKVQGHLGRLPETTRRRPQSSSKRRVKTRRTRS